MDSSLCVLPGSYLTPLELELMEILRRNPADERPEHVCVRLEDGDAALLSPTIVQLRLAGKDSHGIASWIFRKVWL